MRIRTQRATTVAIGYKAMHTNTAGGTVANIAIGNYAMDAFDIW